MDLDFLHLNYRRRIAALVWLRRLVILAAIAALVFSRGRWWSVALGFIGTGLLVAVMGLSLIHI